MTRAGRVVALITMAMVFGACGDDAAAPTDSGVAIDLASDAETTAPPTIPVLVVDQTLPPEAPYLIALNTHCGVRILSQRINGTFWKTDEATAGVDWMPTGWPKNPPGGLKVVIRLEADSSSLTVTYAGRSVVYRPVELTSSDTCA